MHVTEHQLRTVLLAQAIEQADTGRTLVGQAELDEATRSAVAAARQRGVPRVGAGDVVLERSETIAARAAGRSAAVAALRHAGLPWLARLLPLAALLLGLAIDRVSNAHRLDLLSPPLLAVIGWNLAAYALLAWRAARAWRRPKPNPAPDQARVVPWQVRAAAWLQRALGGGARRGLAGRIAADFHHRWLASAGALLLQQRSARVLHLCAAAWGAGIALSLLLRGLVVRYQFGWESTFLDASQVHAIVAVLFWPLTAAFGLAPFSPAEIAATQDFAGEGAAGGRWVSMYVGLLLLAVVLPRLLLAGAARWREARWLRRGCRIDPAAPAFDTLRQSLPGDLLVGLHAGAGVQLPHPLAHEPGELNTPQGDRLRWLHSANTDTGAATDAPPVDAVIAWDGAPGANLPSSWRSAPLLALRWDDYGTSWVCAPALFDQLRTGLPTERHAALERLRAHGLARSDARFDAALQALAQHLRACARLFDASAEPAAGYAQLLQSLDAALRGLHGNGQDTGGSARTTSEPAPQAQPNSARLPAQRRGDGRVLAAVGTSAGAAAGAAAGAKAGALIDVGTGGLTLGAGTALGALLGGASAWVVRSLQKRDGRQEALHHAAEAALTHYLVIAHEGRVVADATTPDAAALAGRWRAEVTGAVAAHSAALAAALRPGAGDAAALPTLLRTVLLGILRRSFPAPGRGGAPPAGPRAGVDSGF